MTHQDCVTGHFKKNLPVSRGFPSQRASSAGSASTVIINYTLLTHWGRDKIDAISQTTFSNVFSSMKMFEFRLRFHWSLFLRVELTIFQHWFRWWLGAYQATSHYLNQWWLIYWRIYASLGLINHEQLSGVIKFVPISYSHLMKFSIKLRSADGITNSMYSYCHNRVTGGDNKDIGHLFLYELSSWWRHQMETFSALLAFGWGFPFTKANDAEL